MADKIPMTPERESRDEENRETPLLDLSDAVKELIRGAERRGHVTHDQINALLASGETSVRSELRTFWRSLARWALT